MKKRTLILASLCGIFLVIAIFQQVLSLKNPVKTVSFSENPDKITISNNGREFNIVKIGNDWILDDNFKAMPNSVELISKYLKEIKILDTVGKKGNSIIEENYNLSDANISTATAYCANKVLRKIQIGKKTATGGQTYITIDDSPKIYLVSGDYVGTVLKSADDLKSKQIYSVPADSISSVDLKFKDSEWGFSKSQNEQWSANGKAEGLELNQEKIDKWISSISYVDCEKFVQDDLVLPQFADVVLKINTDNDEVIVSVYKMNFDGSEYIATSSKSSHKFALSKFSAEKFIKNLDDLK